MGGVTEEFFSAIGPWLPWAIILSKAKVKIDWKKMNFAVSSGPMFNPADAKFINNIKADHTITITSDDGGVNISGYVGGSVATKDEYYCDSEKHKTRIVFASKTKACPVCGIKVKKREINHD